MVTSGIFIDRTMASFKWEWEGAILTVVPMRVNNVKLDKDGEIWAALIRVY